MQRYLNRLSIPAKSIICLSLFIFISAPILSDICISQMKMQPNSSMNMAGQSNDQSKLPKKNCCLRNLEIGLSSGKIGSDLFPKLVKSPLELITLISMSFFVKTPPLPTRPLSLTPFLPSHQLGSPLFLQKTTLRV